MKELTNEDRLKCKLKIYETALEYAVEHCIITSPFPRDYNHGDLEEPWDFDKWFCWFRDKAYYDVLDIHRGM